MLMPASGFRSALDAADGYRLHDAPPGVDLLAVHVCGPASTCYSVDMIAHQLTRFFEAQRSRGVVAAWLFGSEAEGRAHRESDVDVGVLVDRSSFPTMPARSALRLDLTNAIMGAISRDRVDVVVLNDAPPELGRHIVVGGTRLFAGDAEAVHAFERDIQLRAADIAPFLERMRRIKLEWLAR